MIGKKKVVVVMPAYNAEKTLLRTVNEIDRDIVDEVILVDDFSNDRTADVAENLGLVTVRHDMNKGYGGNQKTCYITALEHDADIVVMLHPDYQYSPKLLVAMAGMIAYEEYEFVIASRILGPGAIAGGMPRWKYFANRILTATENILFNYKLSEYHSGYRAYSRNVLEKIPFQILSDDFVFDNQIIAQILKGSFRVGEISCPARYEKESSSINFKRSVKYGFGVLNTGLQFKMQSLGFKSYDYLTF